MASRTGQLAEPLPLAWRTSLAISATVSCVAIYAILLVLSGPLRTGLVAALVVVDIVLATVRAVKLRYRMSVEITFSGLASFLFVLSFTGGLFGGVQFFLDGAEDGPSAVLAGIVFAVLFTTVMWLVHRVRETLTNH